MVGEKMGKEGIWLKKKGERRSLPPQAHWAPLGAIGAGFPMGELGLLSELCGLGQGEME